MKFLLLLAALLFVSVALANPRLEEEEGEVAVLETNCVAAPEQRRREI